MVEAIHLVGDGNIVRLATLTSTGIHRAYDTYGMPPGHVRGQFLMACWSWIRRHSAFMQTIYI